MNTEEKFQKSRYSAPTPQVLFVLSAFIIAATLCFCLYSLNDLNKRASLIIQLGTDYSIYLDSVSVFEYNLLQGNMQKKYESNKYQILIDSLSKRIMDINSNIISLSSDDKQFTFEITKKITKIQSLQNDYYQLITDLTQPKPEQLVGKPE